MATLELDNGIKVATARVVRHVPPPKGGSGNTDPFVYAPLYQRLEDARGRWVKFTFDGANPRKAARKASVAMGIRKSKYKIDMDIHQRGDTVYARLNEGSLA